MSIDASVLIHLAEGRRLDNLRELFGMVAVPALVCAEIEHGLPRHAVNRAILSAPWLRRVAAEDPDDLQLIADLHRLWRSEPPDNAGEAELIALSRRHRWLAILDDRQGREGARREGVHSVRLTTCAVAAAACEVMTIDRAWGLHAPCRARHKHPLIGTKQTDRGRFDRAVETFAKLNEKQGQPPWPGLLSHQDLAPGTLDEMIARISR